MDLRALVHVQLLGTPSILTCSSHHTCTSRNAPLYQCYIIDPLPYGFFLIISSLMTVISMCFLEVIKTLAAQNKLFNVHYILFYSPVAFAITSTSNTELSAFGCSGIRLRNADQVLKLKACIYSCNLHTSDYSTLYKAQDILQKGTFSS